MKRKRRPHEKRWWKYMLPLAISIGIAIVLVWISNRLFAPAPSTLLSDVASKVAEFRVNVPGLHIAFGEQVKPAPEGFHVEIHKGESLLLSSGQKQLVPLVNNDTLILVGPAEFSLEESNDIVIAPKTGTYWLDIKSQTKSEDTVLQLASYIAEIDHAVVSLTIEDSAFQLSVLSGAMHLIPKEPDVEPLEVSKGQMLMWNSNRSQLVDIPDSFYVSSWYKENKSYGLADELASHVPDWVQSATEQSDLSAYLQWRLRQDTEATMLEGRADETVEQLYIAGELVMLEENQFSLPIEVTEGTATDLVIAALLYSGEAYQASITLDSERKGPPQTQLLSAPVITKSFDAVTGSATEDVVRVVIDGYELSKFTPGDTAWKYYVVAGDDGNIVEGENRYMVELFDADENSSVTEITVTYQPE